MAKVVCLGIAVHDWLFSVAQIPATPRKLTASDWRSAGGGMAGTAAVTAARLGGDAEYWGRLGQDAAGDALIEAMRGYGVGVDAIARKPGTRTPVSAVLVADDGERLLAVFRGELDAAADWLPLNGLDAVQAVLADFRWPQGAQALLASAAARGLPRVLDADVGDPATIATLLPLANHAVFSQQGLAEFSGHSDPAQGLRQIAAKAPGLVAVTLGAQGSLFLIDGVLHPVAAFPVSARNTNGAGDVFHGAYVLALAEGHLPLAAARFAAAAAALKCHTGGGWDGVPTRADVERLMNGRGQ